MGWLANDFWCGICVDWWAVLSWFLVWFFGWMARGFKLIFGEILWLISKRFYVDFRCDFWDWFWCCIQANFGKVLGLIFVWFIGWLASGFKLIFGGILVDWRAVLSWLLVWYLGWLASGFSLLLVWLCCWFWCGFLVDWGAVLSWFLVWYLSWLAIRFQVDFQRDFRIY